MNWKKAVGVADRLIELKQRKNEKLLIAEEILLDFKTNSIYIQNRHIVSLSGEPQYLLLRNSSLPKIIGNLTVFLFIKLCISPIYVVYVCKGLVLIYARAVYVLNGTCYGACRHLIGQADQ